MRAPRAKAVFLDRDGVINQRIVRDGKPGSPHFPEEFELLPDVRKACSLLSSAGFLLVVAVNQPEVSSGVMDAKALREIHELMCRMLPIRRVEVNCDVEDSPFALRRKPNPGMLLRAAEDLEIDLSQSFMVGDSWREMETGRRAGCRTVFIDPTGVEKRPTGDLHSRNLMDAARQIAARNQTSASENRTCQQTL